MTLAILAVAVLIGIFAAIAPVGPVTILFVRRAIARDYATALYIGMGRVLPETIYCGLATFGIAAVLSEFPGAKATIEALGTLLVFVLGVWFALQKKLPETPDDERTRKGRWSGFLISAMNPSLLLSWSAISALAMAVAKHHPTIGQKLTFAVGVGCGIALGYIALLWTIRRYDESINVRLVTHIIRGIGVAFVLMSTVNAFRLFGVI